MAIDPSQVSWDDEAPSAATDSSSTSIDASNVKWDDEPSDPNRDLVDDAMSRPAIGDNIENGLHALASGAYHSVVGGLKGIGAILGNKGSDAAADAVNEEISKTYHAPAAPATKYDKFTSLPAPTELGDIAERAGAPPLLSTVAATAPTALATLAGGFKDPVVPAVAPPVITPEEAVANTTASGSMGASAAAPDLSVAPPELKAAISQAAQKTGGAVHPVALERHLDTSQLPLPEGSTPLNLRAGQATGDAQQISDEKNLRADPDTQGLLTDSIADQDKKLVSSMGEIRRQATPDIVQKNNREHGQAVIDAIKNQDNQAVLDTRAKYKALTDANGGAVPIDTGAAISDIDAKLQNGYLTKTAKDNGVVSSVMDDLRSGQPINFEKFENARTRLAEVQRGGGSDGVAAGIVHQALESMPLPPEAAPLKGLADTARAAAKSRFDTIRDNPAYEAAINDNVPKVQGLHVVGADSPLADSFMDRYALGNVPNASNAYIQRLKTAVPDPIVAQSMEAATLNKLRDAAGIDSYGNGSFRNDAYRTANKALSPKIGNLLSPQSIENTARLGRVSSYVNDEGKATSVARSNTPLALQRHGAIFPTEPSVAGQIAGHGVDVAAGHFGPVGIVGNKIVQGVLKKSRDAKALQSMKDAKLKFATEATKPGAGLDTLPPQPRPTRASGGKVQKPDLDVLVTRLINRWKAAKKDTDASTKPLLRVPDATIVKALDIAGRAI